MPDLIMIVDTALAEVPVNMMPLLDATDFKTIEDAVAFDAAGMDLVWNFVTVGGAFSQTAVTPTSAGAHDWASQANGMYTLEIPASGGTINNDTEGFGWFTGFVTGVLPWRGPVIQFSPANVVNSLVVGTDLLDVNASQLGGTAQTGNDVGADVDAILVDTADIQPKIGTPVTDLAADIAAIEAQTDDIGVAGAGLTNVPWNAAWDAEVQSEVADALAVYDSPTNAELVAEIDAVQADIAALNDLDAAGIRGAVGLASADLDTQLAALPTAGENADAVWLEPIADHSGTAGSTAEQLAAAGAAGDPWATPVPGAYGAGTAGQILGDNLNATVSSRATQTSVDTVDGIVDAILVDTGTTLQGELDGIQADTEDIQARLPAALTAGGNIKADALAISGDTVAADNAEAFFDGTGYAGTGNVIPTVTTVTTATNLTNAPTAGDLTAAMKASVNAEVLDVLNVDTFAETSGVPAATATIVSKLSRLYDALINKLDVIAAKKKFYNNSDVQQWEKDLTDDGTTYSETKANVP